MCVWVCSQDAPREGLGGGFLEKQERASSAAAELTEDGYDDFGRKRGAKPSDKSLKEAAALARLNATFGGRFGFLQNPRLSVDSLLAPPPPAGNPHKHLFHSAHVHICVSFLSPCVFQRKLVAGRFSR
jgi:hypothetical protein